MNAIFNIVYDKLPCFSACHDSIERYAKRIGVDLIFRQSQTNARKIDPIDHLNYQILAERESISDLLKCYDRVLALDGDVLVKPDAPSIFDVLPAGKTYMRDETGNGVEYDKAIEEIKGAVEWPKTNGHYRFFNGGVILADKAQGNLFRVDTDEYVYFKNLNLISCEPYYTKRINLHKYDVRDIGIEWNAMVYFKQPGHFIHFANVHNRDELIKEYV
jgi:lipopolysaccharide biosynthesis glycosyltransferase